MDVKDDALAGAFGARLRELRAAAGLTQAQLADAVKPPMQPAAIARYEAGDRGPTLVVVYRLAAALGLSPRELLPDVFVPAKVPEQKRGRPPGSKKKGK